MEKKSEETSLGKVEIKNQNRTIKLSQEELNEKVQNETQGKIDLDMQSLPTKGRFYPIDMKISIRAARTSEIKDFSLMNETDPLDIADKLNEIISKCTFVTYSGGRKGSYKDIVEEDKMYIIVSIRELTFPNGENKITLKSLCDSCDTENTFDLRTANLNYYEEDENIAEFYNEDKRCYVFDTVIGEIEINLPKVGVVNEITDFARQKQNSNQKWDKAAINILPYIITDWRGLDSKKIDAKLLEFVGWNEEKYSGIFRIIEMVKSSIKQQIKYPCKSCGKILNVNLAFEGGLKSIFIRSKQDILDNFIKK